MSGCYSTTDMRMLAGIGLGPENVTYKEIVLH